MTIPSRHQPEESGRKLYGGAVLREDELHAGDIVAGGAYRIEFVLGRGGMSTVYAAKRCTDGTEVALKVLDPKFAERSDVEYRMGNELMLPGELAGHPNIVQPLDSGKLPELGDAPYLATEWVHGEGLTMLVVNERRLPPLRTCRIALDMARGLAAMHERGIVHRDIKPDNVIVVADGGGGECAKLIDFGLVARVQTDPDAARVTAARERPGTLLYMAPEQALGAPAATSFDVYALGLTMHLMLTGFAPLTGVQDRELLDLKLNKVLSIADVRDDFPIGVVELVDGCLRIKPSDRFTIAEVCDRLQTLIDELEQPASSTGPVTLVIPVLAEPAQTSDVTAGVGLTPEAELLGAHETTQAPASIVAHVPAVELEPHVSASMPSQSVRTAAVPPLLATRWLPWALVGLLLVAFAVYWITATPRSREQTPPSGAPVEGAAAGTEPTPMPGSASSRAPAPTAVPEILPVPAPVPVNDTPPVSTEAPERLVPSPRPVRPKSIKPTPEPAHESDACARARDDASAAKARRSWGEVLAATGERACWASAATRTRLRVRALFELGDLDKCVREGRSSADAEVIAVVDLCHQGLQK